MKKLRFVLALALAALMMLVSTVALAAEASAQQQEWWQTLLAWLLPLVGTIVTGVLGALAAALLRRWNINLQQDSIDKVIGAGVHFAEGKALAALNAGAAKTPSAEKLEMALQVATALIGQYKLQQLAEDKLKALIEAKLGEHKVEEKKALLTAAPTVAVSATAPIKVPTWAQ